MIGARFDDERHRSVFTAVVPVVNFDGAHAAGLTEIQFSPGRILLLRVEQQLHGVAVAKAKG
jgi:hypothetical protein